MGSSTLQTKPKSKLELFASAILYEIIGSLLASILMALVTSHTFSDTLVLSIILSFLALIWNMIFNYFFDRYLLKRSGHIEKNKKDRLLHGIGFEAGFAFFSLIFIMIYKKLGFWDALTLEAYFLIFFFIYTIVYTYVYDTIRSIILEKRANKISTTKHSI